MSLKDKIVEWYHSIDFMDEAAIRDPPSKHQQQVRYLQNKIKYLVEAVLKDEGTKDG